MKISYKTIGRNIRRARKCMHLTQEQTAELLGISPLHFGRLERGERSVSLAQLADVAEVLHVPFHALLSGCVIDEQGIAQAIGDCGHPGEETAQLIRELYQVVVRHQGR